MALSERKPTAQDGLLLSSAVFGCLAQDRPVDGAEEHLIHLLPISALAKAIANRIPSNLLQLVEKVDHFLAGKDSS